MKPTIDPPEQVQKELRDYLTQLYPVHFSSKNIFPMGRTTIGYDYTKGQWSASVLMITQQKSEPKPCEKNANFIYQDKQGGSGRERYWYCTYGLEGEI